VRKEWIMTRPNIRLYRKQKNSWIDDNLTDDMAKGIMIGATIVVVAVALISAVFKLIG
jgi:hypothetical protein